VDLYETTYKLPSNITGIPAVTASASDPAVKVAITQAESKTGSATVKFDYKGVVKTYRIVFASE
jgi:arabinoxylan arabinofuranohydrolase